MNTVLIGALTMFLPAASVDGATDEAAAMSTEVERDQNTFVFSGVGPGAGETAIGIGGRLLIVVPMLDVNVVHGFTDRFDLEGRLSTLGFVSLADLGARYRIVGDESFSLAARASIHAVAIFAVVAEGVSVGPVGGLTMSFGDRDWQLSLSQDIPVHAFQAVSAGSNNATGDNIAVVSRTTLAFETMVGKETSLYVTAQAYIPIVNGSAGVLPFLAVGASF